MTYPNRENPTGQDRIGRTRNSSIYTQIRTDILECKILPGERLRFDDLRTRYAVTVGPIREALMRLASDGLVSLEEHKGFTVSDASKSQLTDITRTRCELVALAMRWSIEQGDDKWEASVVARFHELAKRRMSTDTGELDMNWEQKHTAFHAELYSACGSPWLTHFCSLMHDQSDRYRRLWFRHFSTTRDVLTEHREIMEAVTSRDAASATYLIQKHFRLTTTALLQVMPD